VFSKGADDTVAGLDRALRKQRVTALRADCGAFFLHLFVDKREQLESGYTLGGM
jgi:hypothetical protein